MVDEHRAARGLLQRGVVNEAVPIARCGDHLACRLRGNDIRCKRRAVQKVGPSLSDTLVKIAAVKVSIRHQIGLDALAHGIETARAVGIAHRYHRQRGIAENMI